MRRCIKTGGSRSRPRKGGNGDITCTCGSAAVELALLAPILLILFLGIVDFGRIIHEKMRLASAARAGVQYALQSATNAMDTTGIQGTAMSATGLISTAITVTPSAQFCLCSDGKKAKCGRRCGGGETPGIYITVTVTESFATYFDWYGLDNPVLLSESATVRLE